MNTKNKIASSATKEGLVKLLREYFLSDSIYIDGNKVYNRFGLVSTISIISKKGRYTAIQL